MNGLPACLFYAGDLLSRRHFPETDPAQPKVPHIAVLASAPKTTPDDSAGELGALFASRDDGFFRHTGFLFSAFFLAWLFLFFHRNPELHEFLPGQLLILLLRDDARAKGKSDRRLFRFDLREHELIMDAHRENTMGIDRRAVDAPGSRAREAVLL